VACKPEFLKILSRPTV